MVPSRTLRPMGTSLQRYSAAILALLALISLPSAAGVAITWIFSLWGSADLFNAFYQANHAGLLPGQLGATFFIPPLAVPLLLITHGLTFRILLQHVLKV